MKVLIAALIMLFVIGIFIGVHTYVMSNLSSEVNKLCESTEILAMSEDWKGVQHEINNIKSIWDRARIWAVLTISTNEIDKIEISLRQSLAFAKLGAKPDFFGEFTMFHMLINRIPLKEGLHLEEVL